MKTKTNDILIFCALRYQIVFEIEDIFVVIIKTRANFNSKDSILPYTTVALFLYLIHPYILRILKYEVFCTGIAVISK